MMKRLMRNTAAAAGFAGKDGSMTSALRIAERNGARKLFRQASIC